MVNMSQRSRKPAGRSDGGEFDVEHGVTHSDQDISDPYTMFEREEQSELDTVYPDRMSALRKAIELEQYEGAITLSRRGDGYGLTAHGFDNNGECMMEVYDDGRIADRVEFAGQEPESYIVSIPANSPAWENLQPVKDWMNGNSETVRIYSLMPVGYADTDKPDDYTDSIDLSENRIIYCAETDENPDWQQELASMPALRDGVLNATMNRQNITMWPGQSDDHTVYVGDLRGNELMRIGVTGDDHYPKCMPVAWVETPDGNGDYHVEYPLEDSTSIETLVNQRLDEQLQRTLPSQETLHNAEISNDSETLTMLTMRNDPYINMQLVRNPHISDQTALEIVDRQPKKLRNATLTAVCARSPMSSTFNTQLIHQTITDPNLDSSAKQSLAIQLASNTSTTSNGLRMLTQRIPSETVYQHAATNPNTDDETLAIIVQHTQDWDTVQQCMRHTNYGLQTAAAIRDRSSR